MAEYISKAEFDSFRTELVDVLKGIGEYLAKDGDTNQEKAKLPKTAKAGETQKTIEGGSPPVGKPGEGFAKAQEDEEDETVEEVAEDDEKTEGEDGAKEEEMKSLLKDVRDALSKSVTADEVSKIIKSEIKKSVPAITKEMLRKQGFHPTIPDVVKKSDDALGIDSLSEVKSVTDVKKSEDGTRVTKEELVNSMAKQLSWQQLAELREQGGGFNLFNR